MIELLIRLPLPLCVVSFVKQLITGSQWDWTYYFVKAGKVIGFGETLVLFLLVVWTIVAAVRLMMDLKRAIA